MSELIVLMSAIPSAPPARAARPGLRMSVTFGVSLTRTGTVGLLHDPFGDHLHVLGHLADGRAHAAFAHPVRAAEVELDPIGAGVVDAPDDVVPGSAFDSTMSETTTAWLG